MSAPRRVLMIAFHLPPAAGSGVQRAAAFATHLPAHGWQVHFLAPTVGAYPLVVNGGAAVTSLGGAPITRACALDSARHLAWRGRYLDAIALPDRWVSWALPAVLRGLALIQRVRPTLIHSTFPIATSHLIGVALARLSGLPLVAEFRDPMAQLDYPPTPCQRRAYKWVETQVVAQAARLVFVTDSARADYHARYPALQPARTAVLPNGYDEASFAAAATTPITRAGGRRLLLHTGLMYATERDPLPFFSALARLRGAGVIDPDDWCVRLRGTAPEPAFMLALSRLDLTDLVEFAPSLPYIEALREMLAADGLLLFQAANSNQQIPAKSYEYLRAGRPILALVDAAGETAALLRHHPGSVLADLADADAIVPVLTKFVRGIEHGRLQGVAPAAAATHERRHVAGELAHLFNDLGR